MPDSSPRRIDALTGLRIVAALAVVLYHFWAVFLPAIPTPGFLASGFMGVSFFYVLSGYILGYVYVGSTAKLDKGRFWMARFARIYPSYALAFALEIPLNLWVVLHSQFILRRAGIALTSLLANLLMLQAWAPVANWRWNPASWSVSVEAFFYLLFPFLALWAVRFTKVATLAWLLLLSNLLMLLTPALVLMHGVGFQSQPRPFLFQMAAFMPLFRLPQFLTGLLLARLEFHLKRQFSANAIERGARFALGIGCAALVPVLWFASTTPLLLRYDGVTDLAFAAIIFGFANSHHLAVKMMSLPAVVLLGEASYSVYIMQFPAMKWLQFASQRFGISLSSTNPARGFALLAMYLTLLVGFSILNFRLMEAPLRKSLTAWYARRQHEPIASSSRTPHAGEPAPQVDASLLIGELADEAGSGAAPGAAPS